MKTLVSTLLTCGLLALAAASPAAAQQFVGPPDNTFGTGSQYSISGAGLEFTVDVPLTIESVLIYPGGAGSVTIEVRQGATVIHSETVMASGAASQQVTVDFQMQPGSYTMVWSGGSVSSLYRNTSSANPSFPYEIPNVISIDDGTLSNFYYFFYNWAIIEGELEFEDIASNEVYSTSGETAEIGSYPVGTQSSVTFRAQSQDPTANVDINSVAFTNTSNVTGLSASPTSATGITTTNSEDFVIDFEPTAGGTFEFHVEFDHNGSSTPNPFIIEVEGFAGPDILVEDPSGNEIEDGTTHEPDGPFSANTQTTFDIEIFSTGGDDLEITSISTLNENGVTVDSITPSSFTGANAITPGNSETVTFEITPQSANGFEFEVEIDNNSTTTTYEFDVEAGAEIEVEDGQGGTIAHNSTLNLPGSYSAFVQDSITGEIHSVGHFDLDVTLIDTTNHSNVTVDSIDPTSFTGGNEIAPGNFETVTIEFTPQGPGTFEFDVVIDSNDPGTPSYTFTVEGGAAFGAGTYTIDNDPNATPHFTDIGDAISDLHSHGVTGPVVFDIYDDGSGYDSTSDYVFTDIPGSGSANPITFRAASGHTPRIVGAAAFPNYTLRLGNTAGIAFQDNARYITLRGIEFDIDGGDHGVTVHGNFNNPVEYVTIEGCYFHGAQGAAVAGYALGSNRLVNITIRNNWFWNNEGEEHGSSSFRPSQGTLFIYRWENAVVEHNTIFASTEHPAVWYASNFRPIVSFQNNLIVYTGEERLFYDNDGVSPDVIDGNLYWAPNAAGFHNNHPDFDGWQASGNDLNGFYADPFLRDPDNGNLRIAIDSLAKDGAPSSIVQRDIFGTFRPVGLAPDIGAEEAVPSDPAIGLRTETGSGPRHGGSVELDQFGENVPLSYTLYVINERGGTLNLTGNPVVEITQVDEAQAAIVEQPTTTQLGTGEKAAFEIEVIATGSVGQVVTVELQIESDDALFPSFEVALTGEIVPPAPRVQIEREGNPIEAFTGVDQLPMTLPIDRDREIVYTIRNLGSAPLDLTGSPFVQFPSHAGLASAPSVTQTPGAMVDVQDETTFTVRIMPTSATFSFGMEVPNSDPDLIRGDYSFVVQGTAGALPIATAMEEVVDFGSAHARDESNEATVVVSNEGSGDMHVTGLVLDDPAGAWRFAGATPPIPDYGSSIVLEAGGGTLEMLFEFAPREASPEPLEATLEITSNDPETPVLTVTLTGVATAPRVDDGGSGCASGGGSQAMPWLLLVAFAVLFAVRRRV